MPVITKLHDASLNQVFAELDALVSELFDKRSRTPAERAELVQRTHTLLIEMGQRFKPAPHGDGPELKHDYRSPEAGKREFITQRFMDHYAAAAQHERYRIYSRAMTWVFGDDHGSAARE